MSAHEKRAKCPQCLPDVKGAIFTRHGSEWCCNNCHYTTPYTPKKRTGKLTPSQQSVISQIERMGWKVEATFNEYSDRVWVVGSRDFGNPGQNLILGTSFYGTIGKRGAFKLTLQRFGSDKVLTNDIELSVYLKGLQG